MFTKTSNDKTNLIVLGILIRTTRTEKGYSLRKLAELTNISHTLISNIETGKQVPSEATLADLFKVLDLHLHEDPVIHDEMHYYYNEIFKSLFSYEYDVAKELVEQMESKTAVYEFSYEVVRFNIIRCFYYTLTNTSVDNIDNIIDKYMSVIEFLNDRQQQMIYFIKGLNLLNKEYYKDSAENLKKALTIGDRSIDVLIKEYHVRALIRQYKFMDTMNCAHAAIAEFEKRTEYIRAMRVRLSVVRVYLHIMQTDEVDKLIEYVERFATKMKIQSLVDHCLFIKSLSYFQQKRYKEAEFALRRHENQVTPWLMLPRMRIYTMLRDGRVHAYYENVVVKRQKEITRKTFLLIKVIYLLHFEERRVGDDYLEAIEELIIESKKANDQEAITFSYNLLIIYYKDKRSYKKALDVVEEFLHLKRLFI